MDRRLRIARIVLSIPALHLVFVPPIADLNATHVLNPLWPGHARLHTVWLLTTNSLVAVASLWILWRPVDGQLRRAIRLAGALIGAVLGGFFVAGGTRALYDGSFTDVADVARKVGGVDANLAAFSLHLFLLALSLVLTRKPATQQAVAADGGKDDAAA